jgi:type VI protein secretion system component Hcp
LIGWPGLARIHPGHWGGGRGRCRALVCHRLGDGFALRFSERYARGTYFRVQRRSQLFQRARDIAMAVDAFLILKDKDGKAIEGECTDAVFAGSIEIAKFNFDAISGVEKHVRDSEALKYKAEVRAMAGQESLDSFTFSIEKQMDRSSPKLFLNYCQSLGKRSEGAPFKEATVYLCIAGLERQGKKEEKEEVAWVMIEFTKLAINQYGIRLDTELNVPDENITFFFETYKITYRRQLQTGQLDTRRSLGFDFRTQDAL